MSCPEINELYCAMRQDTSTEMTRYINRLQARYGDPRVYQLQEQEMRREEAATLYDQGRRRETRLEDAYHAQVEENRQKHAARVKSLTASQNTHPVSQASGLRSQKLRRR